jgi:hypothetical protein
MDSRALAVLVDEYIRVSQPRMRKDRERFKEFTELTTVIRTAALARTVDDECEPHQHRVDLPPFI